MPVLRLGLLVRICLVQDANIPEMAETAGPIEPVTDHELVGNFKANIVGLDFRRQTARRFVEESDDAQARGTALGKDAAQIIDGAAGIQNVFHQEHVQTLDAGIEVFHQPHLPGTVRFASIAGHGHEIDRNFQIKLARQIG